MTIYFVSDGSSVKIGFTGTDVSARVKSLQTGNAKRLSLIATMEGGKEKEAELHKEFKAERLNGEWFKVSARLSKFIKSIGGLDVASKRKRTSKKPVKIPLLLGGSLDQWIPLEDQIVRNLLPIDRGLGSEEGKAKALDWLNQVRWTQQAAGNLVLRGAGFNQPVNQYWLNKISRHEYSAEIWRSCDKSRALQYMWIAQDSISDVYVVLDALSEMFGIKQDSLKYDGSDKWYRAYKKYFDPAFFGHDVWTGFRKHVRSLHEPSCTNERNDGFIDFVGHAMAWSYLSNKEGNSSSGYLRLTGPDAIKFSNLTMLGWLSHCQKRVKYWGDDSIYVSRGDFLSSFFEWSTDKGYSVEILFENSVRLESAKIRIAPHVF